MSNKLELGERLKRYRLGKNLTLKEVELKAKVSATHVSEIERGMTSPTVGALKKIARALGSDPAYFLQKNDRPNATVVRKAERRVLTDDVWGARLNCLGGGIRGADLSFVELELEAGRSETPARLNRSGEMFMHVLGGVVEVGMGLDRVLLKEGDSLHFRNEEPTVLRNIGDGTARVVWVTTPPMCL